MGIEYRKLGVGHMNNNGGKGRFSANFLSIQLQLKTLLEEAGGDELIPFLDTLGSLNRSEQKIALKVLAKAVQRLVETTPRFATDGDLALKQFEDNLYEDIVKAIQHGEDSTPSRHKIEVIPGGKQEENSDERSLIDLAAARKRRKSRVHQLLN